MPKEPMTEERIAEIRGREKAATRGPWVFEEPDGKVLLGYTPKEVRVCESGCLGSIASRFVCDMHSDWRYTYKDKDEPLANAAFIAHAREDIPALLDEVERLRAANEVLEKALEDLGFFVRTKLDYCPADFIGEGIDEDTDFSCHTEYDPDDASQKSYGDCWADAFRNQAENDIRKFEEWKLRQDMEV